ncbi:MAG: helix-hairpin-helix domain-containing protein [Candidatus Eisenbacteria sp.]|nr:helix-hairpin-helix domain-containing protein [Candidatus Eisenbacteria bacterium]
MRALSRQEKVVVLSSVGVILLGLAALLYSFASPEGAGDLLVPWTASRAVSAETGATPPWPGISESRAQCALSTHLAKVEKRIRSRGDAEREEAAAPVRRININTAGEAELALLDGIGRTRAKAIMEYRAREGVFSSIDEIQKVRGIGPGTFARIADWICTE